MEEIDARYFNNNKPSKKDNFSKDKDLKKAKPSKNPLPTINRHQNSSAQTYKKDKKKYS